LFRLHHSEAVNRFNRNEVIQRCSGGGVFRLMFSLGRFCCNELRACAGLVILNSFQDLVVVTLMVLLYHEGEGAVKVKGWLRGRHSGLDPESSVLRGRHSSAGWNPASFPLFRKEG
jgi:hypothetical protein